MTQRFTSIIFDRQMEQRQAEDSRLMSIETEYGDDYDDQYDEGGLKSSHNWQEEIEKILRVNKLLRNEEAEDAYWEDMRNPNQHGVRKKVDEEEEEDGIKEDEAKVSDKTETKQETKEPNSASHQNVSRPLKQKSSQKTPSPKTESPKGNPKKHPVVDIRTQTNVQRKPQKKTYDKHHQKDKNIRKFGGFMTST